VSSTLDLLRSVTDQNSIHSNPRRDNAPDVDALLKTAAEETDASKVIADANAADAAAWKQFSLIPLYQRPDLWATKSTVANFGSFGFQDINWTKIGFTG
jgi:peptide/nickel transport system substrate-binding protein